MKKHLKNILLWLPFAFFAILFVAPNINGEQIKGSYIIIEKNFENIMNIPTAELIETSNIKKSNVVLIEGDFKSDATYEDIKSYYLDELKAEGWEYVSESTPTDWGKDKGLKALDFKKDEMEMEIFYIPANYQKEYGCNFSISISWDL
jgi:hypothetical protein